MKSIAVEAKLGTKETGVKIGTDTEGKRFNSTMPKRTIATERLKLLELTRAEIQAMEAIAASHVAPGFPCADGYPVPNTTNACRAALEQAEADINGFWLIITSDVGLAIGDLVFLGGKPASYSIAYQIAESQQNQGFGTVELTRFR